MSTIDEGGTREQWAVVSDGHRTDFAKAESPLGYQVGAWVLWVVGLAVEFVAVLSAARVLDVPVLSAIPALTIAVGVVVDCLAVIGAQRLWKKAGSLTHGKRQGPLGVVMACLAFVPMALFFLAARNASPSTKVAAAAGAAVAVVLLIACCVFVPQGAAVPQG